MTFDEIVQWCELKNKLIWGIYELPYKRFSIELKSYKTVFVTYLYGDVRITRLAVKQYGKDRRLPGTQTFISQDSDICLMKLNEILANDIK